MDPESNRVQWAFKGLREHVIIMNSPPNAYPDQEIYIEIPRGSEGDGIIPEIPNVSFKGELRAKFHPNFFFIYRFVYAYYNFVQNFIIFGKGFRKL